MATSINEVLIDILKNLSNSSEETSNKLREHHRMYLSDQAVGEKAVTRAMNFIGMNFTTDVEVFQVWSTHFDRGGDDFNLYILTDKNGNLVGSQLVKGY
jgi:hypothetical protein